VAAEEAKFGDTHVKWGASDWGHERAFAQRGWAAESAELSFTDTFTGRDAAARGIAISAVPPAELDAAVQSSRRKFGEQSRLHCRVQGYNQGSGKR
jgi:enoyl-CoA hydratase/carnithine racemase